MGCEPIRAVEVAGPRKRTTSRSRAHKGPGWEPCNLWRDLGNSRTPVAKAGAGAAAAAKRGGLVLG